MVQVGGCSVGGVNAEFFQELPVWGAFKLPGIQQPVLTSPD